jgi:foldase protein PrsA
MQNSQQPTPTDTASVRTQLLNQKLEQRRTEIASPKVSEAKVKAYYDAHKSDYATEEYREVQVEGAKSKAAAAAMKPKLAKEKFPSTANMSRAGQPPVVAKLAFSLSKGATGGPVYANKYWYVVRVLDISHAGTEPFAQQREMIRAQMEAKVSTPKVAKIDQQRLAEWKDRTTCRTGYVVELCSGS